MIATKKAKLIRKHLGTNTPEWVVKNCIALLKEYEEIEWCGVAETQANGDDASTEPALPIQNVSGSYYYLKAGDEIKIGDEYKEQDGDGSWRITGQIGRKYNPSRHYKHRRLK